LTTVRICRRTPTTYAGRSQENPRPGTLIAPLQVASSCYKPQDLELILSLKDLTAAVISGA
jgi:hypothetical protein